MVLRSQLQFYSAVGFNLAIAGLVSASFHIGTTVGIYVLGRQLSPGRHLAWIATAIWLTAPRILLLGTSTFAEPAAAFLLVAGLLAYINVQQDRATIIDFAALTVLLIAAVLVRRDHVLLVAALPVISTVENDWRSSVIIRVLAAAISTVGIALILDPQLLWVPGDIHSSAAWFSLSRIQHLLGEFIAAWASPTEFGLLLPAGTLGLLSFWTNRRLVGVTLLAVGYVAMFCSFGHTYYYIETGQIPQIHLERYSYELAPLASLIAAHGLHESLAFLGWQRPHWLLATGSAMLVSAHMFGAKLKTESALSEASSRLAPVATACRSVADGSTIVAAEHMLVYLLCPTIQAVSFSALDKGSVAAVVDNAIALDNAYYLERYEAEEVNAKRWPQQLAFVHHRLGALTEGQPQALRRMVPPRSRQ